MIQISSNLSFLQKGNLVVFKEEQNLQNRKGHTHQNWFASISCQLLFAQIFWANSIFWPPWTTVMVQREILAILKANKKGTKSPKPEKSHPPNLISMHSTSTSICMNFLSRFYFLKPIVHGLKGNFGHFKDQAHTTKWETKVHALTEQWINTTTNTFTKIRL